MLTEKDLKQQNTFTKYSPFEWYNDDFKYLIAFLDTQTILFSHNETGEIIFIKTIQNIDDLKESYELLTNKKFS